MHIGKNLTKVLFVMGAVVMFVLGGCERFTQNKSAVNQKISINFEKITQERRFDSSAVSNVLRNEYAYGWIRIPENSSLVTGVKVLQGKTDVSKFVNIVYFSSDDAFRVRISGFVSASPGTYTLTVQAIGILALI
jgi:hypothetical protein